MSRLQTELDKKLKEKEKGSRRKKIVGVLSAAVVIFTLYALVLPAVTMEKETICGVEEHLHTAECYEKALVCGMEEGYGSHAHTEECYDEEQNLICGLEESAGHVHTEECYADELICPLAEHQHTEECYAPEEEQPEVQEASALAEEIPADAADIPGETPAAETQADSSPAEEQPAANDETQPESIVPEETGSESSLSEDAAAEDEKSEEVKAEDTDKEKEAEKMPAVTLEAKLNTLKVKVDAPEGALPEGTTLRVEEVKDEATLTKIEDKVSEESEPSIEIQKVQAVDITFLNAKDEKVEPAREVRVVLSDAEIKKAAADESVEPMIVHMDKKGETQIVEQTAPQNLTEEKKADELVFDSQNFSVYAIVYTVDFHYEANGKTFDFSIPGGGYISFGAVADALGLAADEKYSDNPARAAAQFVADVENITFSNPELLSVTKVQDNTTVGELKTALGLECEYSAELTQEQIDEINIQPFYAGDWALISIHPFLSKESLTITMKNGDQFVIQVTDDQIKKTVISASGETYEITVTYDENAGIPEGAELDVREILSGTDEYDQYLKDAYAKLNNEYSFIKFARFFDIRIIKGEEEIEPLVPVRVDIHYVDALDLQDSDTLSVIHFAEQDSVITPEVITELTMNQEATTVTYNQSSFSVTGTVVSTPVANHQYALVIHHTDGNYYVVEQDGTLTRIKTEDIEFNGDGSVRSVKMINPISWTYQDIGYANYNIWHDTDAWEYDYPGTSLPVHYLRRYLNVDEADGFTDVQDTQVDVWSEALQYSSETHRINHYNNHLGVTVDSYGTLRICGRVNGDNAAEVYFAETQSVPSLSVQNHTVNHIDISIESYAGIKVPLAYGTYRLATVDDDGNITGYRDEPLVVSHGNDVTLEVEKMVPITQDDIKKADITAYTEWKGYREYLDDVYTVTGYSGNAETDSDTPQVRLEGSFKVSDMEPAPYWCDDEDKANNWNYFENGVDTGKFIKQVRLERKIHYTVAVTKPVDFTMTYTDETTGITYVVIKEDGDPFVINDVDVTLSSSFTYWDEDNTCPGIDNWAYGREYWRQGEIHSNDNAGVYHGDIPLDAGPGMDFRLGAPMDDTRHDIVAVEVIKYVQGDYGTEVRTLSLNEATECSIDVYQNNSPTSLHSKTLEVGTDGIGMLYDYDVTAGTYENPAYAQISEDPASVADEVIDANGGKWVYDHSRVETEFAFRNDGNENPERYVSQDYTKSDRPYWSASEVIGEYGVPGGKPYNYQGESHDGYHEYNRFLEFYVYNIYKPVGYLQIEKAVTYNGRAVADLSEDQKAKLAGDYTFTIYTDEGCATPYTDETGGPLTVVITIGSDGQAVTGDAVELPAGTYYIKETASTNLDTIPQEENPVEVTVTAGHTQTEPLRTRFTNDYVEIPIDIIKVDEVSGDPLAGAVFTLKELKDETGVVYKDETGTESDPTNANGETSFTGLTNGFYEITETTLPAGYVKADDITIYVKIRNGEVTYIKKNTSKKPSEWEQAENSETITFTAAQPGTEGTDPTNATFRIKNTPGALLPNTGGIGTGFFTLTGCILAALAGFLLYRRRTVQA